MRPLLLSIALVFGASGCLDMFVPGKITPAAGDDMAATGTGGNGDGTGKGDGAGNGTGQGNGSGGGNHDGGLNLGGNPDGGGGGALAAFGALCTVNADCQSNLCDQFAGGTVHRCTKACTPATAATDCPAPSDGTCNNKGECKFDQ